ncbi:hypothetical protein OG422_28995 [Streptomyces sp. NBC_01525]|uniref:hypothetical protein n=1 Tax=Streptomyces sp. NBC_01525 TaxID=2903893 RepID=UPI00386311C9
MADAQIFLSHSRVGIVAIAVGERYPWARSALAESGFRLGKDGVYRLPADASGATTSDLVRCAVRHRVSVRTSSRRYVGDAARDIASLLPGRWRARVEVYSHPVWQEDLVPWVWDSSELGRVLQTERIPYAATLIDAVHGTTLLLVERPGRQLDYRLGAFGTERLDEGYGDPHAPRSIVLSPLPGRAAHAVVHRYLPAYEHAVHARRTTAITTALQDIRAEHDAWQTMVASGRYSDDTPLSAAALGDAAQEFLGRS